MSTRIAYRLKCRTRDEPVRVVAREAFANHLQERLVVRVLESEDVLSAPEVDVTSCVADALRRFDESEAIDRLLELEGMDGVAYALEALGNAIAYRERKERLARMSSAGRPPTPRAILASCHWTLTELDPPHRLRLLRKLVADFLDEDVTAETLRSQINRAEARRSERRLSQGLPHLRMTAAFRAPS